MIQPTPTVKFEEWQKNHVISDNLPGLTTSAVIELDELKAYIQQIESNANSICINLIRFTWNLDEPQRKNLPAGTTLPAACEWLFVSNGKTQTAIAMSPANYSIDDNSKLGTATDVLINGQMHLLIPGLMPVGPTGHNPPSKRKPTAP